jgi:hypothetical protein
LFPVVGLSFQQKQILYVFNRALSLNEETRFFFGGCLTKKLAFIPCCVVFSTKLNRGPCEGQFRGLFGVDQQWEFSQLSQSKLGNWGPLGCSRPFGWGNNNMWI